MKTSDIIGWQGHDTTHFLSSKGRDWIRSRAGELIDLVIIMVYGW